MQLDTVLEAVKQFSPTPPPFDVKAETWLRKTPDLNGFSRSKAVQEWSAWLCAVLSAEQFKRPTVPPFPSNLHGQQWRVQADHAEDARESCPVGDWLTVYVTYLHACADLIDEMRRLHGWKH
ncbi:MAG: hypothetical protein Q4C67_03720 [Deinococcus sp.]|nr:hypothetical protein [Deinococcus sp.]